MVAPCGCGVLLDTEGKNPTRMFGCVKPNFALTKREIPLYARVPTESRVACGAKNSPFRIYAEIAFDTPATSARIPRLKIFLQKSEHDPVHPLPVAEICPSFNALANETGALRVTNGTLVEAVALEL